MQKFKRALLAAAVGISVSAPASAQFSAFYLFGDSLTDTGYYKPVVPPGTGLFTTNPGPVWATVVAGHLGVTANPVNVAGGTNYAQGGARVTGLPGIPPVAPTATAVPIATQVTNIPCERSGRPECSLLGQWRRQRLLLSTRTSAGRVGNANAGSGCARRGGGGPRNAGRNVAVPQARSTFSRGTCLTSGRHPTE